MSTKTPTKTEVAAAIRATGTELSKTAEKNTTLAGLTELLETITAAAALVEGFKVGSRKFCVNALRTAGYEGPVSYPLPKLQAIAVEHGVLAA